MSSSSSTVPNRLKHAAADRERPSILHLHIDDHDLGPEKRTLRRLEKKVRECNEIAERKTAGVEIECSQLAKLERLPDYQCELEELRGWVWVAHGAVAGY